MKNKHLLLLFLGTVAIGLLSRQVRWGKTDATTPLIRLDTAAVMQIDIALPGQSELLFERTDGGWAVEHEGRSYPVPSSAIAPMLAALGDLQSFHRLGHTERPDTLGLGEKSALAVTLREGEKHWVQLAFGQQIFEKKAPATYLRLGENGGIYLAKHHLRDVFAQKIDFFRKNQVADFDPAAVREVACTWPGDTTLLLQKNDSLHRWYTPDFHRSVSDDSLQTWLRHLAALHSLPFADDFDESRSHRTLRAQITLRSGNGSEPLRLSLHRLAPPELPEDIASLPRPAARRLPVAWVLHSSHNPLNYFSLTDSVLFFGLR